MAETEESLKKGRRADWGRWTVAGPALNTGRPALVFKECATAGRPAVSDWAGLPRRAPSRASRRGSLVKTTETRCNPAGPTGGPRAAVTAPRRSGSRRRPGPARVRTLSLRHASHVCTSTLFTPHCWSRNQQMCSLEREAWTRPRHARRRKRPVVMP